MKIGNEIQMLLHGHGFNQNILESELLLLTLLLLN